MKKLNKNKTGSTFIKTIVYCLSFAWKSSKFYTICRLLSNILLPINAILSSFILKSIIDILTKGSEIIKTNKILTFYLILILFINITTALINKINDYSSRMQNDIIKKNIDLNIINISTNSDLLIFDNAECYDKFAIAQRDSHAISNILWSTITLISGIISILASFVILCNINVYYGIIIIISIIPSIIANRYFTKKVYELSLSQIKGERKQAYLLYLSISKEYSQNIRLFNMNDMLKTRYKNIWNSMFLIKKKLLKKRFILINFLELIPEFIILLININIAFKVLNTELVVGDFILYNGLITQLWSSLVQTISSGLDVYDNKMKIDSIESIKFFPTTIENSGTKSINKIEKIEFKDVYFRYPATNKDILKKINLIICKNEKIALVGTNGSGKSTLIKLLLRFYDPTKGVILINGKDIKTYNITELRQCFNTYFQNSLNFGFSIKDNIVINNSLKNYNDITNIITRVDGQKILRKTPNGVDTYLTRMFDENGIEVSGGEHQKIALARTFIRNANAVILDEPSSALDPKSEDIIFKSIEEMCKDKIVLFTSHRLTNIFLADKILVLENGIIVESGTKNQLLKNKKRFAELYKYQADKFKLIN